MEVVIPQQQIHMAVPKEGQKVEGLRVVHRQEVKIVQVEVRYVPCS